MALLTQVELWLTQFLDHLPKSDHPAIGAGYVMAAAATIAAVVFGVVTGLLTGVAVAVLFFSVGDLTNPFAVVAIGVAAGLSWLSAAGMSLAVVVPGGFVGGVTVWRIVPESLRLGGFVGGLLATLVGYLFSWGLLLLPAGVYRIAVDPSVGTVTGPLLEFVLLLGFSSAYTVWATVPAGLLSGYLYERSLR
jgi:hypothetical protein